MCKEVQKIYPFDIFKENYLDFLAKDRQNYKVRLYLISAQNLTAVNFVMDLKSRLAGYNALCSANPYPVIKISDGLTEENRGTKMMNDREQ